MGSPKQILLVAVGSLSLGGSSQQRPGPCAGRAEGGRRGWDLPAHSICIPPPDSDFANPGCWRPGSTLGQQCNPSWFPHLYTCYCDNCEALGPKQRKTRQHSLAGIIPNGVSLPDICVCPPLWLLTASGLAGQPWGGWCDLGLPFLLRHLHQAFGCRHGALSKLQSAQAVPCPGDPPGSPTQMSPS